MKNKNSSYVIDSYVRIINVLVLVFFAAVLAVASSSSVICYNCQGTDGGCMDEFSASSDIEQDCSEYGYTDDGGCSKLKNKTKLLGVWVTTGKLNPY